MKRYERSSTRKFQLRADESASANLLRAALNAAGCILRRKRLRLTPDEFDELVMEMALTGIDHFMRKKIREHTYNRRFTFFQNVYGSVWCCSPRCINKFLHNIKIKLNSVSLYAAGEDGKTILESVADTGRPLLNYVGRSEGKLIVLKKLYDRRRGRPAKLRPLPQTKEDIIELRINLGLDSEEI